MKNLQFFGRDLREAATLEAKLSFFYIFLHGHCGGKRFSWNRKSGTWK